jgi:hypothetical protein
MPKNQVLKVQLPSLVAKGVKIPGSGAAVIRRVRAMQHVGAAYSICARQTATI